MLIYPRYDWYSWAKPPTITSVEVNVGKTLHEDWLWSGTMTCVDEIRITARTSDGKVFTALVCMAIRTDEDEQRCSEDRVVVTSKAEERLCPSETWYHFGGWSDEGDTNDTQMAQFDEYLDRFCANVVGPDENLRRNIVGVLQCIRTRWKCVTVSSDRVATIQYAEGTEKTLHPPRTHTRRKQVK